MKSNLTIIGDMLSSGSAVYMCDDFEEVAIRLERGDGDTIAHLKHKGRPEIQVDRTAKIVFETKMGGRFITEQEYDQY